jgi:hypothetical protein
MKDFDIFIWASDYEDFTGEGLLARCFVRNYFLDKNLKIKIISYNSIYYYYKNKIIVFKKKKYKNNFLTKYVYPLLGIAYIWYYKIKRKKVCYLNYLPLWNFIIFFLLPKKTILGTITGSIYKKEITNINTFIRKIFFPFFYFVSLKIIYSKFKFIIFSTGNLKKIVSKDKIKSCVFNFCFLFFEKRKKKKKNIDFLFYIRNHPLKSNIFQTLIINRLVSLGFKVVVVGDKFEQENVVNYINLPRLQLLKILDQTKYTLVSDENFFSMFAIDCLSCGCFIFYNSRSQKNIYKISNFIPLRFDNLHYSEKIILKSFEKNRNIVRFKNLENFFSNQSNKIKNRIKLI